MRFPILPFAVVSALCASGCHVAWNGGSISHSLHIQSDGKTTTITRDGSSLRFDSGTPDAIVTKPFAPQAAKPLKLTTDFGSIKAIASPDGKIGATAMVHISQDKIRSEAERKALAQRFQVTLTANTQNMILAAVPPADLPKDIGYTVSWQVAVPAALSLDLKSENGMVTVEDTGTAGKATSVTAASTFGGVTVAG